MKISILLRIINEPMRLLIISKARCEHCDWLDFENDVIEVLCEEKKMALKKLEHESCGIQICSFEVLFCTFLCLNIHVFTGIFFLECIDFQADKVCFIYFFKL